MPEIVQSLEKYKPAVLSYAVPQSREPTAAVEEALRGALAEQYREIELWMLACIRAPEASQDCKRFLCRMLQRVGSADAVSTVAPLLRDAQLSHMAILALEHVSDGAVDGALRAAVPETTGSVRLGIIKSLGERRKPENVDLLAGLLDDPDTAVRAAAAIALGKCADPGAIDALRRAMGSTNGVLRATATRAYLVSADRLLAQGRNDAAARMFDEVFAANESKSTRTAAFLGRVAVQGDEGPSLVLEALKSDDPDLRAAGLHVARTIPGSKATEQLASLMTGLAGPEKELLLSVLADRGGKTSLPAVLAAAKDNDGAVRCAAYEALAFLGDVPAAMMLADVAARGGDHEADIARESVTRIPGKDVDEALIGALDTSDAALRAELIRMLVARKTPVESRAFLGLARDENAMIRAEALKALAAVGLDADIPQLLELMGNAADASENDAVASAIISTVGRLQGDTNRTGVLLAALSRGRMPQTRSNIINALSTVGDEAALATVCQAVRDLDPEIQDAAVHALAGWPSAQSIPALLDLARGAARASHRIIALRGFVDLLERASDWSSDKRLEGYRTALGLAARNEDKKYVLGGLATVATAEALAEIAPYLDNPELLKEAVASMLKIAAVIAPTHPAEAEAALRRIAAVSTDENTQATVKALLLQVSGKP